MFVLCLSHKERPLEAKDNRGCGVYVLYHMKGKTEIILGVCMRYEVATFLILLV